MMRILVRFLISLVAAAAAFVVADVLLGDRGFSVSYPLGLVLPVVLFAVVSALLAPIVDALLQKYATQASLLLGLIVTWLSLLITTLVSDRLSIEGVWTWVLATLIVWLASLATAAIMSLLFRDRLAKN
jgi:uncharacterized membrane protein YvlD (DUF360 family)